MQIKRLYPGVKEKAFNITYDDGVEQDVPFIAMLNRYGIKGTFNLNSELMRTEFSWRHPSGVDIKRLGVDAVRHLYDGHEVASHSLTHPYMRELSDAELHRQMAEDKRNLEALFGREVAGFAVPFSYYSDLIADCARECGFEYARRSEFTENYTPCGDFYHWRTGFYHICPGLADYVAGFLNTQEELAVCQIVGHSYDLDAENLWGTMELICAAVSKCDDIWFCTNGELVEFLCGNG
jgi:peptidoglycan/xylan/chitin deacetylase (PgdA/CDA1 family)